MPQRSVGRTPAQTGLGEWLYYVRWTTHRAPEAETAKMTGPGSPNCYRVWRVSHPYHSGVAVRLICWFPPDARIVAVALFGGDKPTIGDLWYNSVGARADALIDQWKREVGYDR
jgi:hypothetical protein